MREKLTSDIPAIPDPYFVSANVDTERFRRRRYDSDNRQVAPMRNPDSSRQLFEIIDAASYIERIAVYSEEGTLDIEASAEVLGIPVVFELEKDKSFCKGYITGITPQESGLQIEIHIAPDGEDKSITFGHEVGHYFLSEVYGWKPLGYDRAEEHFCDYFGRQMVMPKSRFNELGEINEALLLDLVDRYSVGLEDLITQLQEYGLLPSRLAIDTYNPKLPNLDYSQKVVRNIICKHCHDVGGDRNCPEAGQACLLFDFTDKALALSLSNCCGEDLHLPEIASTLTKHYQELGRLPVASEFDVID